MNRTLLLMAVAAVATSGVKAQSVTYNHDSPKQNRITVMETGTGALSPELYYTLLHNKYKKSAASKNKLSFRTLAGVNLYNQDRRGGSHRLGTGQAGRNRGTECSRPAD